MPTLFTLKDHFKESQLYLNRTVTALSIVIVLVLVLILRLFFLQVYQHDFYKTLSLNNQVRITPITPTRGLIYDRRGRIIADNIPAFSLEISPERIEDLKETLALLGKILPVSETELQQFFKQLKYKRRGESIPLKLKLTEEEVARFSIEKHRFTGVEISARLIRYYPYADVFSHALGYIGPISDKDLEQIDNVLYHGAYYIGKTGLEKFYESLLYGSPGYQHIESDAKGRMIRVLNRIPPKQGHCQTTRD